MINVQTAEAIFLASYRYYCQACLTTLSSGQFVYCAECERKYSPYL